MRYLSIIKKDLKRYWLVLIVTGAALTLHLAFFWSAISLNQIYGSGFHSDFVEQLGSNIFWIVMILVLIPAVIHDDHPKNDNAFYMTRPLSEREVAYSKWVLITFIGVIVPTVGQSILLWRSGIEGSIFLMLFFELLIKSTLTTGVFSVIAVRSPTLRSYFLSLIPVYIILISIGSFEGITTTVSQHPLKFPTASQYAEELFSRDISFFIPRVLILIAVIALFIASYRRHTAIPIRLCLFIVFVVAIPASTLLEVIILKGKTASQTSEEDSNKLAIIKPEISTVTVKKDEQIYTNISGVNVKRGEQIHIFTQLKPAPPYILRLKSGAFNLNGNTVKSPIETSSIGFSGLLDRQEIELVGNLGSSEVQFSERFNNYSALPSVSVSSLPINLNDKGRLNIEVVGTVDAYKVEQIFSLDNDNSTYTEDGGTTFQFAYGMPTMPIDARVIERVASPLFKRTQFLPINRMSNKGFYGPDSEDRNYSNRSLVLLEMVTRADGTSVIYPLNAQGNDNVQNLLWPRPLVQKRIWTNSTKQQELDSPQIMDSDVKRRIVGIQVSYAGTIEQKLENAQCPVEVIQ